MQKFAQVWFWPAAGSSGKDNGNDDDNNNTARLVARARSYAASTSEEVPDAQFIWRGNVRSPAPLGTGTADIVADIVFVHDGILDLEQFSADHVFVKAANAHMSSQIVLVSANGILCSPAQGGIWETESHLFLAPKPHALLAGSAETVTLCVEWDYVPKRVRYVSLDPLPGTPTPEKNQDRSAPLDAAQLALLRLPFMVGAVEGSSTRPGWYDFPHGQLLEQFIERHGVDMVTTIADVKHTATRLSKWCPLSMLPYHPIWEKQPSSLGARLQLIHVDPNLQVSVAKIDVGDIISGKIDTELYPFMLDNDKDMSRWGILFVAPQALNVVTESYETAESLKTAIRYRLNDLVPWFVSPSVCALPPNNGSGASTSSRGELLDRLLFRSHSGANNYSSANWWVQFLSVLSRAPYKTDSVIWAVLGPTRRAPEEPLFFQANWILSRNGAEAPTADAVSVASRFRGNALADTFDSVPSIPSDSSGQTPLRLKTLLVALGCVEGASEESLLYSSVYLPQILFARLFRYSDNSGQRWCRIQSLLLCRSTPDYVVGAARASDTFFYPSLVRVPRWTDWDFDDEYTDRELLRRVTSACQTLQEAAVNRVVAWELSDYKFKVQDAPSDLTEFAEAWVTALCDPERERLLNTGNSSAWKLSLETLPLPVIHSIPVVVVSDTLTRLPPGVHAVNSATHPVIPFVLNPGTAFGSSVGADEWILRHSLSQNRDTLVFSLGYKVYFTLIYIATSGVRTDAIKEPLNDTVCKFWVDELYLEPCHFEGGITGSVMIQVIQNMAAAFRASTLGLIDAATFQHTDYYNTFREVKTAMGYYLRGNTAPVSFYDTLQLVPCTDTRVYVKLASRNFIDVSESAATQKDAYLWRYKTTAKLEDAALLQQHVSHDLLSRMRAMLGALSAPSTLAQAAPAPYATWEDYLADFCAINPSPNYPGTGDSVINRALLELQTGRFDTVAYVNWCMHHGFSMKHEIEHMFERGFPSFSDKKYMTGSDLIRLAQFRLKRSKIALKGRLVPPEDEQQQQQQLEERRQAPTRPT